MQITNKVVRISYSGGLLGLLFGSSRGKLEKVLTEHNRDGWNLAEVVSDNPNVLIWLVRFLLLLFTLGLWTLSTGQLLVLERRSDHLNKLASRPDAPLNTRRDPTLSAQRSFKVS
jgi:hypothetical protein